MARFCGGAAATVRCGISEGDSSCDGAFVRVFKVYLGVFYPQKLWTNLFLAPPTPGQSWRHTSVIEEGLCHAESELYGRTFATWTILTCTLCIICSRNPENQAIYGGLCSGEGSRRR